MKWLPTLAAAGLALALAGCLETVPEHVRTEVAMASACQSFSDVLETATVFKSQMSPETIARVNEAVEVAQPACHAFRLSPDTATETILNQVRDALRTVVLANQERRA